MRALRVSGCRARLGKVRTSPGRSRAPLSESPGALALPEPEPLGSSLDGLAHESERWQVCGAFAPLTPRLARGTDPIHPGASPSAARRSIGRLFLDSMWCSEAPIARLTDQDSSTNAIAPGDRTRAHC